MCQFPNCLFPLDLSGSDALCWIRSPPSTNEHLHRERLRQPQGVSGRTPRGVWFGYGQHPADGSSCVGGF